MISSTKSVYARNTVFLLFSFIWIATVSVLPQVFFLNYAVEKKGEYLGMFLTFGTLISFLGIYVSSRFTQSIFLRYSFQAKRIVMIGFTLSCALSFASMVITRNLWVFIGSYMVLRFITSIIYNDYDHASVCLLPSQDAHTHVQSNLLYQMLGYLIAPFFFGIFPNNQLLHLIVILGGTSLSLFFVWKYPLHGESVQASDVHTRSNMKWTKIKVLFILYVTMILCAVIVLTSSLIYILRDYYHFENPVEKGGVLIGIVSLCCIAFLFVSAKWITQHARFSLKQNVIAVLIFMGVCGLIYTTGAFSFLWIALLCSLFGMMYGVFLFSTRKFASNPDHHLISAYNNCSNASALIGYALMLWLSQIVNGSAYMLSKYTIYAIFLTFVFAGFVLVLIAWEMKSTKQIGLL